MAATAIHRLTLDPIYGKMLRSVSKHFSHSVQC
jgi:hypothetical protein